MKFRATLEIDIEVADQQMHEKFGTVDAYTAAGAMRQEFEKQGQDGGHLDGTPLKLVGVSVVPRYGT